MAIADERFSLLDRRLAALRQSQPELARALDFEDQLVRASSGSPRPAEAQPFALPREHAVARLRAGVPLLHDQPAQLDLQFAADMFNQLILVFRQQAVQAQPAQLDQIEAAATCGQLDPQRLFGEAFVNHADHLAEHALDLGLDPALLSRLATLAVGPLLRAYADRLRPMIERIEDGAQAAVWRRGYCPVCGGWPIVGELDGDAAVQVLRCGACGSGWDAQRPACPYCGNDDARQLRTLSDTAQTPSAPGQTPSVASRTPSIASEDRLRVSACDRCQGYLKIGGALGRELRGLPSELLALEDIASTHLDRLAVESGYRRPDGSGFRIELAVPEEEWLDELDAD
jgi:formate dehydrogenase maturation protein FdhE